jgi:signal transduction histidine kinase
MTTPHNVDFSLVLASSVHDMKNSIGMLISSLESCIEEFPPANQRQTKHFNTLHYEASRINSELVQLLTIYRMQNNHLPLRVDQHYVIDVLEDQLARNHSLLENRGVHPRLECDDSLQWFFDSDLVGSVVQNVIVNCSRYTRAELLVSAKLENDFLRITVADDGSGYPPSMLEAPSMLVQSAEVSEGNTHLGLYFAEEIARLHKQKNRVGYIRLENGAPLGGGCFNLFLP